MLVPDRFYITTGSSVISNQPLRREFMALTKFKHGYDFRQKKRNHLSLAIQMTQMPFLPGYIFLEMREYEYVSCVLISEIIS